MVVYWDLVAAFNFLADYLLLLCTARLSGGALRRGRLAAAAGFGALYAVAQLLLPRSVLLTLAAMALMCALAFGGSGRALRLTLLFALVSCAFGGLLVALGGASGAMERLARGVLYAQLPWGVFFAAAGLSYLLLSLVFRGGARHTGETLARVKISYRGKSVTLTLLRDTGNTLRNPRSGAGVPVVNERAVQPLFTGGERFGALPYRCVGTACGTLKTFTCDALTVDGRALGARCIALTPEPFDGTYAGLWCEEEETNAQKAMERTA